MVFIQNFRYYCPILTKLELVDKSPIKFRSTKFRQHTSKVFEFKRAFKQTKDHICYMRSFCANNARKSACLFEILFLIFMQQIYPEISFSQCGSDFMDQATHLINHEQTY